MPLTIVYQDENGKKLDIVNDWYNLIAKILPNFDATSSYYLPHIDVYDDTTFNSSQMDQLKKEFESKLNEIKDDKTKTRIKEVLALIDKCKKIEGDFMKIYEDFMKV